MLYVKLTIIALLVLVAISSCSSAFAAQLSWDTRETDLASQPKFTFQRTINIGYQDGGIIGDDLRGKHEIVQLSADGSSQEIAKLIESLNKQLEKSGGSARISDLKLEYYAELTGHDASASIEYNIILTPKIDAFLIQQYSEKGPTILDVSWRGLNTHEPIMLSNYDITKPISFLKAKFPKTYGEITGTRAEILLSKSIIDASGIQSLPLAKWHSLFDPTAIIAETQRYGFKGAVVTTFSMGTSDIFNPTKEKLDDVEFTADRTYRVSTFEAADNAVLFIPGYASAGMLGGYEIIQTGPKPPLGIEPTPKEQFPIFVIYGMAAMAAVGAGGFFLWSGKKAKKDSNLGQTGIDPSHLRGMETSKASGGYHTNRGEAQLADSHLKADDDLTQSKRVLPKGWENK